MRYTSRTPKRRRWPRRLFVVFLAVLLILTVATVLVRRAYDHDLQAVNTSQQTQSVVIKSGANLDAIAKMLKDQHLIRSVWAFKLYVSTKQVRSDLEAGTYSLAPSQSVSEIVSVLTHGKVATSLVTILPGQRIDQIRTKLITDGFSTADVDAALSPVQYISAYPKLFADFPSGATLEGYLYPDSFQKASGTQASTIIKESLAEMQDHVTSDIIAGFKNQGYNVFQGIMLASIVNQEVSSQSDRNQVAQVLISRLKQNIPLGSDVTARYGAVIAGKPSSVLYDSAYNTRMHAGLPPGPISNVNASALTAVAHPANTAWLYFVSGDNGTTYFSQTLQEHDQQTQQYCHQLCAQ